jgi:opacity protein-like surface antigen
MRKNHVVYGILLAILTVPVFVDAQLNRSTTKVGTTVAQFLKIGASARSLAMGGSAASMEGDVYTIYWNPGALSRLANVGEAAFTHAEWLADINYDFAAVAVSIEGFGVLGVSLTSLGIPEDIVRTEANPNGDGRRWDASSFSLGVAYARSLTDRFSIGMVAKYIREAIWNEDAQGVAFDIGTIYTTPFNDMRIGVAISNFGTKLRLDGRDISFNTNPGGEYGQGPQNISSLYKTEEYDIPLLFRLGISMEALKMDQIRATVSIDATHPNDNVEYINSGLELAYDEMFFGRVGYKSLFMNNAEDGLTWGVGVRFNVTEVTAVKVDYAFADYGRLKNVQFVSLAVAY